MLQNGGSTLAMNDLLKVLPETIVSIGKKRTKFCRSAPLFWREVGLRVSSRIVATSIRDNQETNHMPESVELFCNRFKERLSSTHFVSSGTSRELVIRAEEDGIAEACFFAAETPGKSSFLKS